MEQRRIRVIIQNEADKDCAAIYRLRVGEKYYIGSTGHTTKRAALHEWRINKSLLPGWSPGRNSPTLIYAHLRDHPEIETLYLEVIAIVDSDDGLVEGEQFQFNICATDQNCLNFRLVIGKFGRLT
jgi:hypothetical protein